MYSTSPTLTFKPVVKDRLFYSRFEYSLAFMLPEVSCLRELDHSYIDRILERRRQWREVHVHPWYSPQKSGLAKKRQEITPTVGEHLHRLADVLLQSPEEFKLVTSVSRGWVYTNSLELITELLDLGSLLHTNLSRAVIDRPHNTIRLTNPKHQNRAYFKRIKLTTEQKDQLANFFTNQLDYIRVSPALTEWFDTPFLRTQDYFFIDFDEDAWLLMLALIHPGLIRKTVPIIPAK